MYFVKGGHENPITPHEDSFDELNLLSRGQSRQNLWRFDNRGAEPASWVDNPWLWAKYLRRPQNWRGDPLHQPACAKNLVTLAIMASPCAVNVTRRILIAVRHQRACSTQIIL